MPEMKNYSQKEINAIKERVKNDPDLMAYMATLTRCCMMAGFWAASDKTKLQTMDETYEFGLDYGEIVLHGSNLPVTDYLYAKGLMDERINVDAALKEMKESKETEEA